MGFLSKLSAIQIKNRLQSLTGANRLDASAIKGLSGLQPWQLKTTNYTAIAGDRLRVDASVADIVITLPPVPNSNGADIWIQRLDTSANKVLLRSGGAKIKSQFGQDGVFAPVQIDLIERISYINSTIGWLGQHGLLTYQAYDPPIDDPYWANVSFLLRADANGFTDLKGASLTSSNATLSTISMFGQSVQINNGEISIPNSAALIPSTGDWTIDFWYREVSSSGYGGIFMLDGNDLPLGIYRAPSLGSDLIAAVGSNSSWYQANISMGVTNTTAFDYYGLKREGSAISGWKNGSQISSFLLSPASAIGVPTANAVLGNNSGYHCNGYYEEFRITNGIARDLSVVPTDKFPTL